MAKIEISKESLESFSHNKNVCGISQNEVIAKRIIAPIDEKNVCSDWIEEIFDDYSCTYTEVKRKHKYCGFVDGELVMCSYTFGNNTLQWVIYSDGEKLESVRNHIMNICKEIDKENDGLVCEYEIENNAVYQSFFFDCED